MPIDFQGVGLNLHLDQLDYIQTHKPDLPFIEVIADNWLSDGPHHLKLEKLRQDYQVVFHCVNSNIAGTDPLNRDYFRFLKKLKDKYQPRHISDHLCVQAHKGVYFHDLLPFPLNRENIHHCRNRIEEIQTTLNQNILVENLSYYLEFPESEMNESQFLAELVKESGCSILLDLNNIWVNQQNLGFPMSDYLGELDLEKVQEIHIAGAERFDGLYIDTHGSQVKDEVLEALKRILPHCSNIPVIYERDNHVPSTGDLLEEVTAMNKRLLI